MATPHSRPASQKPHHLDDRVGIGCMKDKGKGPCTRLFSAKGVFFSHALPFHLAKKLQRSLGSGTSVLSALLLFGILCFWKYMRAPQGLKIEALRLGTVLFIFHVGWEFCPPACTVLCQQHQRQLPDQKESAQTPGLSYRWWKIVAYAANITLRNHLQGTGASQYSWLKVDPALFIPCNRKLCLFISISETMFPKPRMGMLHKMSISQAHNLCNSTVITWRDNIPDSLVIQTLWALAHSYPKQMTRQKREVQMVKALLKNNR